MFFSKNIFLAVAALFCMLLVSCVKDVDLNQAGDISLAPRIQSDLIIFEIDEKDFVDVETNELKTIIRDTVRLEFLDDSYIQKDLEEVEFSFKYINTFDQDFRSKISFLSEQNRVQHSLDFYISGGSAQSPTTTEIIDHIGEDRIQIIKRSIKMLVEIEVIPNGNPFTGKLNFQSKGLFSFQF